MKHPNELDQQLDNLRTLQQSYDAIAGAAEAYNTGKVQLAQNITAKGVDAAATETLPELAEKVAAISQETYEINGGEMYAKQLFGSLTTPNYWNLYDILAQLLSDGRLVNYGGILLAEYYKGYDSLALAGAGAGGAYVVSDKDSDGNFIMYTNDTTHTWATEDDGKGNRWVAYCFADEYHDFDITNTNTSPRSIYIGRKVGTITSLVAGRCSKLIIPDGNVLKDFVGSFAQNWDAELVIRNIQGHTSGYIIYNPTNTETMYVSGKAVTTYIASANADQKLTTAIFDFDTFGGALFQASGVIRWNNLQIVYLRALSSISIGTIGNPYQNNYFNGLKELHVIAEQGSVGGFVVGDTSKTIKIFVNYITNDKTKSIVISREVSLCANCSELHLQEGWCKPINISTYTAFTEANIYTYILQRLKQDEADCGDGVTITLGATNLAKLTSEESVALLDSLTNIYGYTFA